MSVILFAIIITFLLIWNFQYQKLRSLEKNELEIQAKIDAQTELHEKLEQEKAYMNTDAYYEDKARLHLNMIKQNEMIIVNRAKNSE